jgi:hypothetical protein
MIRFEIIYKFLGAIFSMFLLGSRCRKLMPYVLPKTESVKHTLGEPELQKRIGLKFNFSRIYFFNYISIGSEIDFDCHNKSIRHYLFHIIQV